MVLLVQVVPAREAFLLELLRRHGHHVLVASSVSEALTFLEATIPDLVVLGTLTLEMSLLVSKLENSYSRGMRPQLVTETESTIVDGLPSWLAQLDLP